MKRVSERVRGVVQRVRQLVCAISFVGIRIPTCWCVVNDLLFWLSFRLHSFSPLTVCRLISPALDMTSILPDIQVAKYQDACVGINGDGLIPFKKAGSEAGH